MSLASIPRGAFRVRIVKQHDCPKDLGPHCVQLRRFVEWMHVARHTTRASAEKHATRLLAALRGEA